MLGWNLTLPRSFVRVLWEFSFERAFLEYCSVVEVFLFDSWFVDVFGGCHACLEYHLSPQLVKKGI